MDQARQDRTIGRVTVLTGERGGKYPHGNALLVRGREETVAIDPSLSLVGRAALPPVDRVLNSHCHEDHVAGNHLFPRAAVHVHEADLLGLRSLDGLIEVYGMSPEAGAAFARAIVEQFHYAPRADAAGFAEGAVFDLGGTRVRAIHTPGHTRGHCAFLVEPEGVLYLGDIDLSSFGPYYGDAWSSLEDFERSLARVREIDARHYATFHHVGVVESCGVGEAEVLRNIRRQAVEVGVARENILSCIDRTRHPCLDIRRQDRVGRRKDRPCAPARISAGVIRYLAQDSDSDKVPLGDAQARERANDRRGGRVVTRPQVRAPRWYADHNLGA